MKYCASIRNTITNVAHRVSSNPAPEKNGKKARIHNKEKKAYPVAVR